MLAGAIFIYCCVTLTPFKGLGSAVPQLTAENGSNTLNQIVAAGLFGSAFVLGLRGSMRPLLLRPLALLLSLLLWMLMVSAVAGDASFALRRLAMAFLICVGASVFLLLPRSEAQFARLLALCNLIVLGLCYAGVVLVPRLSIHQDTDFLEPALAGDWRGMFDHKNSAAPAMVVLIFIGLYVAAARSRLLGWAIAALALLFLWKTGGKTAIGLLPFAVAVTWLLERARPLVRWIVVLVAVGGYGLLTLGTMVSEPLRQFVVALGIDDSFTGRTDIWQIALDGIRSKPVFGYGYDSFWGTENLVFGFREVTSWAVGAPAAHNSYLDVALSGGVVGLVLTLLWLVVLPTRDLSAATARNGRTPLTRLFTRIWIFCLLLGCMESFFLATNGGVWFCMMVAVFGLRLQARAMRREAGSPSARVNSMPVPA